MSFDGNKLFPSSLNSTTAALVGTQGNILQEDTLAVGCLVTKIKHYKNINSYFHKYLQVQVEAMDEGKIFQRYIRLERCLVERSRTSRTSSSSSGGFASDKVRYTSDPSGVSLIERGDELLQTITFVDRVTLSDFTGMITLVTQIYPMYQPTAKQSYWYAWVVTQTSKELWKATVEPDVIETGFRGADFIHQLVVQQGRDNIDTIIQQYRDLPPPSCIAIWQMAEQMKDMSQTIQGMADENEWLKEELRKMRAIKSTSR
ncbi:hypothetical protein K439DRAFT_1625544 [Ramaria rubella]|nr:hypothetical protein K439DRAFT_1625544 [Ramaria rubella]